MTTWKRAIVLMAIGLTMAASSPVDRVWASPQKVTIEVSAERFAYTPSEISAKVGSPLEIQLTSEDTDHGFRILGTDINVRIPKRGRGTTTVLFEPTTAGRYTFECSHVCGAGHSFMRGTIVVTR